MSLLDEVADHEGVLEDITRCEALVGLPGSQPLLSVEAWVMGLRESRRTMSKKGKCFFSLTISLSSFHCASVGSIPVGFWEASANHTPELEPCSHGHRHVAVSASITISSEEHTDGRRTIDPSGAACKADHFSASFAVSIIS